MKRDVQKIVRKGQRDYAREYEWTAAVRMLRTFGVFLIVWTCLMLGAILVSAY